MQSGKFDLAKPLNALHTLPHFVLFFIHNAYGCALRVYDLHILSHDEVLFKCNVKTFIRNMKCRKKGKLGQCGSFNVCFFTIFHPSLLCLIVDNVTVISELRAHIWYFLSIGPQANCFLTLIYVSLGKKVIVHLYGQT